MKFYPVAALPNLCVFADTYAYKPPTLGSVTLTLCMLML